MNAIAESANTSSEKYDKLQAEVDDALDKVLSPSTAEADETKSADVATEAVRQDEPTGKQPADADASPFKPNDEQLARAIKAGLSVSDANAIPNAEMLDRICSRLEENPASEKESGTDAKANGEKDSADDEDIPQLPTDKDFDEDLVRAFNRMSAALKEARGEIASLKKAGSSAEETSWFDKQFNGLGETLRKSVDDRARGELRRKFDTLEAGYKATGASVQREDVFKEAVSLALGGLIEKAKAKDRAAALDKRSSLHLAMPGYENGSHKVGKSEDDALKEVARLVSEKFGN